MHRDSRSDGGFEAARCVNDTPIRRYADTPIRRHADTPTRRYADTPIRRYADTPIRPIFIEPLVLVVQQR